MTVIFAPCPFCKYNLMTLNLNDGYAACSICCMDTTFSDKEISKAKARSEKINKKYLDRITKIYEAENYVEMSKIATKMGEEGISSWFAWFCIGWSDLHERKTNLAFQDFMLAAKLSEDDFDEFYNMMMKTTIDSIIESANNGDIWCKDVGLLLDFDYGLLSKFGHLMKSGFIAELLLETGRNTENVESADAGIRLYNELFQIAYHFLLSNVSIKGDLCVLKNTCASIESIGENILTPKDDSSNSDSLSDKWCGYVMFLKKMIAVFERIESEYSENDIISLEDYSVYDASGDVVDCIDDAFTLMIDWQESDADYEEIANKVDEAVADYEKTLKMPLIDGRAFDKTYRDESEQRDYNRICPDCNAPLKADETGLMVCECGFKSRIVTESIELLPDDIKGLIDAGEKAYAERDPEMLNNIGEKIILIDEDHWYGNLALARSCLIDGEYATYMALLSRFGETAPDKEYKKYRDIVVKELIETVTKIEGEDILPIIIGFSELYHGFSLRENMDRELANDVISGLMNGAFDSVTIGFVVSTLIMPTITYTIVCEPDLMRQKETYKKILLLTEKAQSEIALMEDGEIFRVEIILTLLKTYHEMMDYTIKGIEKKYKELGPDAMNTIVDHWKSDEEGYVKISDLMLLSFCFDEKKILSDPKAKGSKRHIKKYLDSYADASLLK